MSAARILALDIDGTLIGSDKRIPAFTGSEVRRVVEEYGVRVVLVTARGPQSTAIVEEQLGVAASYCTFGGALVWAREPDGAFTELAETPLEAGFVREALAIGAGHDVHAGVYTRDEWRVNRLDYWGLREARNTAVWPDAIDAALTAPAGADVFKVMFRGEADELTALEVRLRAIASGVFVHRVRNVIELVPASAVKLPALRILLGHLGADLAEVIAFGDTLSDLELLENVGTGVLMGNAAPELGAAAHVARTLSNDEDGIGVMLRAHFPTARPFRP
ncbi:HAD-IIB family hydrolase [uncultured Leifsonia sp.]|uniref:HAD-IIB family hydrolase n=1 Tax=uncultured Leifsonia sp. TaxID=340359 RepID=UPI0028D42576|nr:HAD-IIB family hydrolase [uncultured Leifsonia sp.]